MEEGKAFSSYGIIGKIACAFSHIFFYLAVKSLQLLSAVSVGNAHDTNIISIICGVLYAKENWKKTQLF